MSRTKSPPETHRECRSCHITKPLNLVHFAHHRTGRNGWHPRCRKCQTEFGRAYRKMNPRKAKPKPPLKTGQRCDECEGLAHRRPLAGCPRCRLAHVPEPKVEPVLRQFQEVG